MKFKRRARQDIDVNMTPMIDIVFLLLIFFMVSTTFTKESRLGLNLPSAEQGVKAPKPVQNVEVVIDAQGAFFIDKKRLPSNDKKSLRFALEQVLANALAQEAGQAPHLTISADAATAHQYVVSTMDIAGQLGFAKLSISTLKQETP